MWDVRGKFCWNICKLGLGSSFLWPEKKKFMCFLGARAHSWRPADRGLAEAHKQSVSQRGGREENIRGAGLTLQWFLLATSQRCTQILCFSSYLGGHWRAKGRWRICIYRTNLQLVFGSTASYFSLGEVELLEDIQLCSSGSSRNPERGWLYSRLLWCFGFNNAVSNSWIS